MARKTAADVKPTARQVKVAELVNGGMSVQSAMAEAGYGPGCIPGLAPVLADALRLGGVQVGARRGRPPKGTEAPTTSETTASDGKGAKAPAAKTD